jgi:hypothetical protein
VSLVEEFGARVHGAADELPLGSVTLAVQRLRVGLELLQWVRQSSVQEVGVVHLANASEQLEQVALALRTAQDSVAAYLTAIGLSYDAAPTPDHSWRQGLRPEPPPAAGRPEVEAAPLGRWWAARVDEATGHQPEPARTDDREAATDPGELLRRVAAPVRSGDRGRLREELRRVPAPVGLGLSAITPALARHLATDLLGHEPEAADLPELTRQARQPVRELLPGVPEHVLPTLLARVCRMPPPARERREEEQPSDRSGEQPPRQRPGGEPAQEPEPTHPTDPAVTWAVLTGVLLHRLGRDPDTLREPEKAHG